MNEPNLPFSGKVIVFGGDFMQTLPVVKRGNRSDIVSETVRNSRHWHLVVVAKDWKKIFEQGTGIT